MLRNVILNTILYNYIHVTAIHKLIMYLCILHLYQCGHIIRVNYIT
jgi:hypothetical protein